MGSYVLRTRLPRGGLGSDGADDSSPELVAVCLRGLTGLMEYLVVTRV